MHDEQEHRQAANRAIAFSALGLATTGGIELGLALMTHSVALLGDSLHNLSDVSTSAVVFLGFFLSKRPPSPKYPYGYERAEDLAGLGVALVIWLSAIFAGYVSYEKLIGHSPTIHPFLGMAAAALGMIGNFAVSYYKRRVGERIHSMSLKADAQHSWLDVMSSLGALVGLFGVALGYRWADPIAGLAVTLFVVHVGYEVTSEVAHHLMDGVDPGDLQAVEEIVRRTPGIASARVRGRWMGRSLVMEIDAEVPATTTIGEADRLGEAIQGEILKNVEQVRQVRFSPSSSGLR